MRTLTLAAELIQSGFRITYLTRTTDSQLQELIRNRKCGLLLLDHPPADEVGYVAEVVRQQNVQMVICDSYAIDASYELRLKEMSGKPVFSFDDTYEKHYADFVLNQNIYAKTEHYRELVPDGCNVFAGLEYSLIRPEFKAYASRDKRTFDRGKINVLLTLGGSDENNIAAKVMRAIEKAPYALDVTVVCGNLNPHYESLVTMAKGMVKPFSVIRSTDDMAGLMYRSDIAITAGGSTTIETLVMRLPSLVITVAENQERIVQELQKRELAVTLGWHHKIDDDIILTGLKQLIEDGEMREKMQRNMASLFEKDGVRYMIDVIRKTLFSEVSVQPATFDDCDDLLELANDETVRKHSFSQDKITLDGHKRWLQGLLDDPARLLLTVKADNTFLGQIRFDGLDEDASVISISFSPLLRGLGMAEKIVRQGIAYLSLRKSDTRIIAMIKKENRASLRSFEKAGFSLCEDDPEKEIITMEYTL